MNSTYFSNRLATRFASATAVLACTLALPYPAFAQQGTPEYIESMSSFSVLSLSGNRAPADGNISMEDVTPSEWLNNDPSSIGLRGVIVAWSGGAKGTGSKLYVHGGGHNDSANNGLYIFDFSGTDRPSGWTSPIDVSNVSAVRADTSQYADGRPVAVHTYDGMVYASHNNSLYRFAGSQYQNGFFTPATFRYDLATRQWTRGPNYPSTANGAKTIYDPGTGKVFVTMANVLSGHFYRTSNNTWSSAKSYSGGGLPFNSTGAWDSTRNRGIIVGSGASELININFQNETINLSGFSASGSTTIFNRQGPSVVYDPSRDVYWMFAGDQNSPGYSTIYEMNADGPPWTVTAHSLSQSIPRSNELQGSWGRFVLMDNWRAIGLVASETSPVYVIRLPPGTITRPEPPTNLTAD